MKAVVIDKERVRHLGFACNWGVTTDQIVAVPGSKPAE